MNLRPGLMIMLVAALMGTLSGCAGTKAVEPAERLQAQLLTRAAVGAATRGNWQVASKNWQEAAQRHASLDDWTAAGRATLGEAQALVQLGQKTEAIARLTRLLGSSRYVPPVQAEARYQLALLAAAAKDAALAAQHLDAMDSMAGIEPALQGAVLNLRARLAADQGDWQAARQLAARALVSPGLSSMEAANAQRLIGEAAMQTGDWHAAEAALNAALTQDRIQARSAAIAQDLALLAELADRRGSPEAAMLRARADDVCNAVRDLSEKAVCAYNRGLPRSGK
ncbi:tetratricopeptide repeat protein [Chitinimonas sp. BJYL2]|uniref:tetratricopeptide repeat protein n=1 Tax=Chitinimonas sp. BJYL2 TaxID=2976696 RepID=UPI0022B33B28|nr:tetratricopeptide repeat protein [Chitinimonas sp. BJYL2]